MEKRCAMKTLATAPGVDEGFAVAAVRGVVAESCDKSRAMVQLMISTEIGGLIGRGDGVVVVADVVGVVAGGGDRWPLRQQRRPQPQRWQASGSS